MKDIKELLEDLLENQIKILENQHFIRKAIVDLDNSCYKDITELKNLIEVEANSIKSDIYFYTNN